MLRTDVDGAYSWIVAGSSFFVYMMMYGSYRLSGIMFVESMPRYGVGRESASFPYTFAGFTKNVSGPIVGILLHKFHIRTLILSGCALAAIGIGACFFAENIFVVTVLWGVVFGFGFALATALLPVLINQYFSRQRATAAGFAFSGMCMGSMIFPPLVETCIEYYGISGTFLIISGLVLNCFPLAIFLRARIPDRKDKKSILVQKTTSISGDSKVGGKESQTILQQTKYACDTEKTPLLDSNGLMQQNDLQYSSMYERKTVAASERVVDSDIKLKSNNSSVEYQTILCEKVEDNIFKSENNESCVNVPSDTEYRTSSIVDKNLNYNTDDVVRQKIENIKKSYGQTTTGEIFVASKTASHWEGNDKLVKNDQCQNSNRITKNMNLAENLSSKKLPEQKTEYVENKSDHKGLMKVIQDTTIAIIPDNSNQHTAPNDITVISTKDSKSICSGNCSLLLNFTYLVVVFTKTLANSIALCVNTVIFDYARDIGIATVNEKYILIFSSMGELLGRLCLGRIADINCMSKSMFLVICSVGQVLGALAIAWSTGFYYLSAGLFVFSFAGSVVQFMMPLIIADGIVEDKQAFAITSSSFLAGPASLMISPLIGYLRDEIGTYSYLFYGIAVLSGLSGIVWLIVYFLIKPKPSYAKIK